MEKEGLFTTVVGSWPLENTPKNMIKAFEGQIEAGIDYVCYPQLVSMNSQFLTPLSQIIEELEQDNEYFYLSSDFQVPEKPFALKYGKFIVNYLKDHPDVKRSWHGPLYE